MSLIRHVLFCTDLTRASDHAFDTARGMAEECGAEMTVLHVLESKNRYSGTLVIDGRETWATREDLSMLRERLSDYYFEKRGNIPAHRMHFAVQRGVVWMEILRAARKVRADHIVLGPYTSANGATAEHESRLGENAQAVSLRARCPVTIATAPGLRMDDESGESGGET